MSQMSTRGLGANSVDDTKVRLRNNNNLRGRNAADSADINLLKVNASNQLELALNPYLPGVPVADLQTANKKYVDDADALLIPLTQKGAANGVATLDAGSKIPVAQLPNSIMEFQGNWNATTNSPTLADATGSIGDVYRVNVAGTQNLGSGSQTFVVGDYVILDAGLIWRQSHGGADAVQSVNGAAGVVVLTTSDIAEGTNLYFTAAAAKAAAVSDAIVNGVTDVAPSQNAVFDALALKLDAATFKVSKKEVFTLGAGDITNQYIDLTQVAETDSIMLVVKGFVPQLETDDYTVSYTGGAGGKTRISFAGDLATGGNAALVAGDKLAIQYRY
jgi:hypothetical protein